MRGLGDGGVAELVKAFGETELVENFECGGVDRVAAKFAIEILVHFEERDANAPASQEQRQHRSARDLRRRYNRRFRQAEAGAYHRSTRGNSLSCTRCISRAFQK